MFGNFVFDIDGAMAVAVDYRQEEVEKEVKEKFGLAHFEKYCLTAMDYPHYIFPGYYALFQWLHQQGGRIIFFSSGVEKRNLELAKKMIKRSFGETKIDYQVFSRKHCVDTREGNREEAREKYQSYFFGNRKKKLAGIIVPEEEIGNTLLLEDDSSYMTKGEEYNLVKVPYSSNYIPGEYRKEEAFMYFHKAYYLAGVYQTIFEARAEKNMSLIEGAKWVQMDLEEMELSRDFYYASVFKLAYYEKGLDILKQIDPTLDYFYKKPDELTDWRKKHRK